MHKLLYDVFNGPAAEGGASGQPFTAGNAADLNLLSEPASTGFPHAVVIKVGVVALGLGRTNPWDQSAQSVVKRRSPRADIIPEVRAGAALDSTSPIVEYQSESDHAISR